MNYFRFVVEELREIMASLGISRIEEMIGRTELLELNSGILPWKAKNIDYSRILYKPRPSLKSINIYEGRGQPKVPRPWARIIR